MRILVADDEPEMTMVLEALLQREHYSVDVVNDGQDALDYKHFYKFIFPVHIPYLLGQPLYHQKRLRTMERQEQTENSRPLLSFSASDFLTSPGR